MIIKFTSDDIARFSMAMGYRSDENPDVVVCALRQSMAEGHGTFPHWVAQVMVHAEWGEN